MGLGLFLSRRWAPLRNTHLLYPIVVERANSTAPCPSELAPLVCDQPVPVPLPLSFLRRLLAASPPL